MTETIFHRGPRLPVVKETMPDLRTLVLMGQDIMQRALSCFTAQGVVPPNRQVVYMAPIPADCEQIAVLFSGWTPMPFLEGLTHCDTYRWIANFSVVITRCTPAIAVGKMNKTAPTPEQMLKAAEIASADAEVLLCLVAAIDEVGPELEILTPAPQGGMQTVELTLQVPAYGGLE